MCGSRPLAEAVTRSTGIGSLLSGSAAFRLAMRPFTASISAGFSGPWFEPLELAALLAMGDVADGRPQKFLGSEKFWPIRVDPTALPPTSIRLPAAWVGNAALAMPVTARG